MHRGYPLATVPGANVFFTNEDVSTPDGLISCTRTSQLEVLLWAAKAGRLLKRLADVVVPG